MVLGFKIVKLDIFQSYFKGKVEFAGDEYTINIQPEKRGKVLKLPLKYEPKKERLLVRLTGPREIYVEDFLPFGGKSDWIEIDSDMITFYIADHQDQFDTLEILDN